MEKFLALASMIITAALLITVTSAYPYDHREDTVLPFSLSPGNVNLETYYLDKYPQPGVPGGPIVHKPTPQMKPALDPVAEGGNTFLVHHTKDPHAMFRTRRAAYPTPQHGYGHGYPHLGSHNHGHMMGTGMYGLYNEDNLHLHQHPRYGSGGGGGGSGVVERHHQEQERNQYRSYDRYHNHHRNPSPNDVYHNYHHDDGRY